MPRACTVCTHPQREAIDQELVAGSAFPAIAAKYRVSEDALGRHKAKHVPAALAQAQDAHQVAQADNLLDQVRNLQRKALAILGQAEAAGDLRTAVAAIREARGNLELLSKLLGELDERPTVNVLVTSPEWIRVRRLLMDALADYPEARAAVARTLHEADHAG